MQAALNQMTVRHLDFEAFLDLARELGCVGVEVRNDLGRPLFDGLSPAVARGMLDARGLRLLGMSQVYGFNIWSDSIRDETNALLTMARAAGAETISLIPLNEGMYIEDGVRQTNLRNALTHVLPMLEASGVTALVEPLGFERSSLRSKQELVEVIADLKAERWIKLVYDTFHHTLAHGGPQFAEHTGIVHISGLVDPSLAVNEMEDEHRVLVDADDRLGNIDQIRALQQAGYDGALSYECFAPSVHSMADPYAELKKSFEFIASQLSALAA